MDIADPVTEEDETLGTLLIRRAVLQHAGMPRDSGKDAVVVASRLRDLLDAAGHVEKMPFGEALEVQPGAGRDPDLDRSRACARASSAKTQVSGKLLICSLAFGGVLYAFVSRSTSF